MADQYDLSNSAIFSDLERLLTPISKPRHVDYLRNGTIQT